MSVPPAPLSSGPPDDTPPDETISYPGLRLAIRFTGVLLMLGGVIYLATVLRALFWDRVSSGHFSYHIVITLLAFGLGSFVLRAGWAMLCSVDSGTISLFSFLFALIYTPILFHLLPSVALLSDHPAALLILMILYFGLTYLILNRILLFLLFPRSQNGFK